MQDLKISIIQNDPVWESPAINCRQLENDFNFKDAEIVFLPEMFNTGFSMNVADLAEPMNGPTHSWMQGLAKKHNTTIAGSIIIHEQGNYYNRFLWVYPSGHTDFYDKIHLFTLGKEHLFFTAGKERKVINHLKWLINLQICYDLRFPLDCATRNDIELQVFIASWPEARAHHFEALSLARAIENQTFVIALNRCGTDGNGLSYKGQSRIISPKGESILTLGDTPEQGTITLSKDELILYRKQFPFLQDWIYA